MAFGADNS